LVIAKNNKIPEAIAPGTKTARYHPINLQGVQFISDSIKSTADYGASGLHYWSKTRSQNRLRKQSALFPALSRTDRQLSAAFGREFFPSLPLGMKLEESYHNSGTVSTEREGRTVFLLFFRRAESPEKQRRNGTEN
jgi:hypothetical protein